MNRGLRPEGLNHRQNQRVTRARGNAGLVPPGDFAIRRPLLRERQLERWARIRQEHIDPPPDPVQPILPYPEIEFHFDLPDPIMAQQQAAAQQNAQNGAPRPALRPSDFLPARFSGEKGQNARAHYMQFEDYLMLQGLQNQPDAEKIGKFVATLSGPARIWFHDEQFGNLAELRTKFLSYFSGMHTREASARQFRLIKYRPGTTIGEYLSDIRACAERLGYGNDMIQDQFLAGLPQALQVQLSMMGDRPLNELVQMAQRYLDLSQPVLNPGSAMDSGLTATLTGQTPGSETLEKNVNTLVDQMNALVRHTANVAQEQPDPKSKPQSSPPKSPKQGQKQNYPDSPRPNNRPQRRGYYPPRQGGYRPPPRNNYDYGPPRQNPQSNGPPCFVCQKPGHRWRECRTLRLEHIKTRQPAAPAVTSTAAVVVADVEGDVEQTIFQ